MFRGFLVVCVISLANVSARAGEAPTVIDVWPGKVPGEIKPIEAEKYLPSKPEELCQKKLTNVSKPTLTIYRPAKEKDTGAAVVIAPGGGYHILAEDLEGEEVAAWLNSIGVTGIVLKYRVPRRADQPAGQPPIGALQDAQRAVSLVRSRGSEWGIDPNRIGILGFSAGGHLSAWTSTNADRRAYEPIDAVDKVSCRPDFTVLVYPAYLQKKAGSVDLNPEIRVSAESPPCFFAHAGNDPISAENSVAMYLALKKAGVPAELHLYAEGGHGFGLRAGDRPCSTWPKRCEEWMKARALLKPKS